MSIRFDPAMGSKLQAQVKAHPVKTPGPPVASTQTRSSEPAHSTFGGSARPIGYRPGPNTMLPPVGFKGGANNM